MFQSKKIKHLENEIEFLKDRLWVLENPPKFKNGDIVFYKNGSEVFKNNLIVESNKISYSFFMHVAIKEWQYNLFDVKKSKIVSIFESDLILTTDVEQTNNTTSARD